MLEGQAEQLAELLTMHFWGRVISIPEEQEAQQGIRWVRRLQESSEWMALRTGVRESGHVVMLQEGFALRAAHGSCAVRGDFGRGPQGKARLQMSTLSQQCKAAVS